MVYGIWVRHDRNDRICIRIRTSDAYYGKSLIGRKYVSQAIEQRVEIRDRILGWSLEKGKVVNQNYTCRRMMASWPDQRQKEDGGRRCQMLDVF